MSNVLYTPKLKFEYTYTLFMSDKSISVIKHPADCMFTLSDSISLSYDDERYTDKLRSAINYSICQMPPNIEAVYNQLNDVLNTLKPEYEFNYKEHSITITSKSNNKAVTIGKHQDGFNEIAELLESNPLSQRVLSESFNRIQNMQTDSSYGYPNID